MRERQLLGERRDPHNRQSRPGGAWGFNKTGVFKAVEFLWSMNLGDVADVGGNVVVIGGGNVAFDAARTAARAVAYQDGVTDPVALEPGSHATTRREMATAMDAARGAIRAGAPSVTIIALESPDEMPAAADEIEEGVTEGVKLVFVNSTSQGHDIFASRCATCHGDNATGGQTAPTLNSKLFLEAASDPVIRNIVSHRLRWSADSAADRRSRELPAQPGAEGPHHPELASGGTGQVTGSRHQRGAGGGFAISEVRALAV